MEKAKPSFNTFQKICSIAESLLGNNISIVFEFGSRYGEDTIEFAKRYPHAIIYGFECNEITLPICLENIKPYPNIQMSSNAISDHNGPIAFYPIDKDKTITTWEDGNQGASSLFRSSGQYPLEHYFQSETIVQGITLKSFMISKSINKIDILWMDIQGAELMALKGLDDYINNVNVIQCEVEKIEIYTNQPLFKDIISFLEKKGFVFMGFSSDSEYSSDAIFINKRIINHRTKKLCKKILYSGNKKNNNLCNLFNKIILLFLKSLKYIKGFDRSFNIYKPTSNDLNQSLWRKKILEPLIGYDVQYRRIVRSIEPIDVIIPVHEKDIHMLEPCIHSIKKYLKHPIDNIFIISSSNKNIKKISDNNRCVFVDENSIIPNFSKSDICYFVDNNDRSGWLYQQIIKLSADIISDKNHILVMDSDTIFNRPVKYIHKGKNIINISDEHYETYYRVYRQLLNEDVVSKESFVSHTMLFERQVLIELKKKLEQLHHDKWFNVILNNVDYKDISGFSEYETYGNYILNHYPEKIKIEYWFNKSIKKIEDLPKVPNYYKTVSIHSYNISND